jgi:hypothetical protein
MKSGTISILRSNRNRGSDEKSGDNRWNMKEQQPSFERRAAASVVNAIQWATAKVFRVSLHDLAFGTITLRTADYPQQLRLACTAGLYLCRKHTELAAATIARSFNRRPQAVGPAVRSIERLLAEQPIRGELLSEVEGELGPAIRQAPEAQSPGRPLSRTGDDF